MPRFTARDGTVLHFEDDDFTDPWARAPVIVLQHGLLKSSRFGYAWVPYLSRFFRVIRPDLRGHGRSQAGHCAIDDDVLLDDLRALLDHLEVEQAHYCGEALGGIIGVLAGARMPQRLRSLSLVSAPMSLSPQTLETFALGYADWETALRTVGILEWSRRLNRYRFGDGGDEDLQRWQSDEMGRQDLEAILRFVAFASRANVAPEVANIRVPVLGLYAVQNAISGAAARFLQQQLPSAQIVDLPSRHHTVFNTLPATCARHVLKFCSAIEERAFDEN